MGSTEAILSNKDVEDWIPDVKNDSPKTVPTKYGINSESGNELLDSFIPLPPKSPAISTTDSFVLTPTSSHIDNDDAIYSDSELGSQNSLELSPKLDSERDSSPSRAKAKRNKRKPSTPRETSPRRESSTRRESSIRREGSVSPPRENSPRRESSESTPKPKKRIRRKSNRSDGSERSHPYIGSGYASTPATGKVFRNLLILEENLRQQVFRQKALRRKYLTFMAILCALITSITHYLYILDDHQPSTSPIRVILTFVLLALLVTLSLYYLSGEYQKTIVLPRKFLSSTNKGLRQLNIRLVKIKVPLLDYFSDLTRELMLYSVEFLLNLLHSVDPQSVQNKNSKVEVLLVSMQSQCQPRIGIADVKLVLNARVFNTDVREGWELYRSEFWLHEGMRRRNNLLTFVTGVNEDILDREKLLRKDKRERKDRKRSNTGVTSTPINELNDENLKQLAEKLDNQSSVDDL